MGCWHVHCQIQSTMKPDQTFDEIKSAMHQIQQNPCLIIEGTCKFRILLKINCHDFTDDCAQNTILFHFKKKVRNFVIEVEISRLKSKFRY